MLYPPSSQQIFFPDKSRPATGLPSSARAAKGHVNASAIATFQMCFRTTITPLDNAANRAGELWRTPASTTANIVKIGDFRNRMVGSMAPDALRGAGDTSPT